MEIVKSPSLQLNRSSIIGDWDWPITLGTGLSGLKV